MAPSEDQVKELRKQLKLSIMATGKGQSIADLAANRALQYINQGQLNLYDVPLSSVPELPEGITSISLYNNGITSLPELPSTLKALQSIDNKITELPPLPNTLEMLDIRDSDITNLQPLPDTLKELTLGNNTHLVAPPKLPASLTLVQFINNGFLPVLNKIANTNTKIQQLRKAINAYYAMIQKQDAIIQARGRNVVTLRQTFGPALPENIVGVIAGFFSGEEGSTNQQIRALRNQIKGPPTGGRRRRVTRHRRMTRRRVTRGRRMTYRR